MQRQVVKCAPGAPNAPAKRCKLRSLGCVVHDMGVEIINVAEGALNGGREVCPQYLSKAGLRFPGAEFAEESYLGRVRHLPTVIAILVFCATGSATAQTTPV